MVVRIHRELIQEITKMSKPRLVLGESGTEDFLQNGLKIFSQKRSEIPKICIING